MAADPRVSLLVVDPDDTGRFLLIRGSSELVEKYAIEHLDRLTRKYTRHPASTAMSTRANKQRAKRG